MPSGAWDKKSPIAILATGLFALEEQLAKTIHVRFSPGERTYLGNQAAADGVDMTEYARRADQWMRETFGNAVLGQPRRLATKRKASRCR